MNQIIPEQVFMEQVHYKTLRVECNQWLNIRETTFDIQSLKILFCLTV